jgi:hypothetical protein
MGHPITTREGAELIKRCLAGELKGIDEFQQRYGEIIYSYPIRVYRMPAEDAGDFYVFAFDGGRIFRRLQTFAGRTSLPSYLSGFVLDNLVLEWKRGEHEIETISMDALNELPDACGSEATAGGDSEAPAGGLSLNEVLATVGVSKGLVIKLLYIEDCDLTASDIRCLAKISGRRVPDLLADVERLRCMVREREAGLRRIYDALDAVHAWIQLYERRLRQIGEDLANLPPDTAAAQRRREERALLERKVERRRQQRGNMLARAQRRKVTAPYKDIAVLLNTSIGNLASQILRVRKEIAQRVGVAGLGPGAEGNK